MKAFWALFIARNKEFYRDRGSMAWNFIFPLMIIVGCALAFSRPDPTVFKLGVVNGSASDLALAGEDFIEAEHYADAARAQEKIAHHQLHLLIDIANRRYWINPASSEGRAAEQLFLGQQRSSTGDADTAPPFQRETLSGRAIRYVDWVMPGVLGMNMMFAALFGVGYVIVRYRQNGVLKRLQATPINALQFISAQLMSRLVIVLAVNATIFIGCNLFLDLLVLGSYFNLLLIATTGAMAMVSLGLVCASRTSNEELASGALNAVSWPMMFLSDVWFSLDRAPQWLQFLADLLPLTHIVKAARAIMIEGAGLADIAYHLLWLVVATALFIAVAAALFRWHEEG